MKRLIIIAALILAAIAPMRAQEPAEWTKENDSTWVRHYILKNGIETDFASPVDMTALTAQINNDLRSAALCQAAAFGTGLITGIEAYRLAKKDTKTRRAGVISFGLATLGLEVASICHLYHRRVYMTSEGVIVKIGRTEKPGAYAKQKK